MGLLVGHFRRINAFRLNENLWEMVETMKILLVDQHGRGTAQEGIREQQKRSRNSWGSSTLMAPTQTMNPNILTTW